MGNLIICGVAVVVAFYAGMLVMALCQMTGRKRPKLKSVR